jgi:hypothetical protein
MPRALQSLSWVPLQLKACVNGHEIGVATGFVYEHEGRTFLVTNCHVVSGRHAETQKVLAECGYCPDSLSIGVPVDSGSRDPSGASLVGWRWHDLALFSDDDSAKPIWFEHPTLGRRCDIAAIPLAGFEDTKVVSANSAKHGLEKIPIYPGLEAFVLGYPRGMKGPGNFPIWKRATIATEPAFDLDGLPKFYIDTATRDGMSGSPVYAQEVGYWMPEGETDPRKALIGKGQRFVGVYSGRIGADDQFKAQLGIVWRESSLISVLDSVPREEEES